MALLALLRGGGDLASGVALRLARAGIQVIVAELPRPLAVRRLASFAQAIYDGQIEIEGITGRRVEGLDGVGAALARGQVPVLVDPDADIAAAIWGKKDVGCDYNGNTTATLTDTSGYSYPYPTYTVKFERPTSQAIKFAVEIVDDPSLPSDVVTLVQNAIIARFNGTDGTTRERIGATVFASRYYGAVTSASDNISLISILIGTSSPTLTQVPIGIDQRPTLTGSDITVTLI